MKTLKPCKQRKSSRLCLFKNKQGTAIIIMKKIIFSTAAIAATFVVFSFSPAEKNNDAINKADVTSKLKIAAGACDAKFQTNQTFSKCDTRWTESPTTPVKNQSTALAGL